MSNTIPAPTNEYHIGGLFVTEEPPWCGLILNIIGDELYIQYEANGASFQYWDDVKNLDFDLANGFVKYYPPNSYKK